MISRANTQTRHHRRKENPENHYIRPFDLRPSSLEQVQEKPDEEEEEAAEEVGMDVDGFVVDIEEGLEAFGEGVCGGGAVGGEDVGVVLVPGGEVVVAKEERARGWCGG
ncbi:MAG: hypothetical protein Q9222_006163 [Ikaeria aurantiellina]